MDEWGFLNCWVVSGRGKGSYTMFIVCESFSSSCDGNGVFVLLFESR